MDALVLATSSLSTAASVTTLLQHPYGFTAARDQLRAAFYALYAVALWLSYSRGYPSDPWPVWIAVGFHAHDVTYAVTEWRASAGANASKDLLLIRACEDLLLAGAYATVVAYVPMSWAIYATAVVIDILPAIAAMAPGAIHPLVLFSAAGGLIVCVAIAAWPLTLWHGLYLYMCGALTLVRLPSLQA